MTDKELQDSVQRALEWEPSVDAGDIGVSAETGVVTLRGYVKSYSEKSTAERVTLRVYGVRAVANDLIVRVAQAHQRSDTEIAQAALSAMKWNTLVPDEKITVAVSNGWVTLKGKVDWEYQRAAADKCVRHLVGVCGLNNVIEVAPHVNVADVKAKIETALKRSAEVDARRINVVVADGKVTLTGNVHSWAERNEARYAAWGARGVKEVEDKMAIAL